MMFLVFVFLFFVCEEVIRDYLFTKPTEKCYCWQLICALENVSGLASGILSPPSISQCRSAGWWNRFCGNLHLMDFQQKANLCAWGSDLWWFR